MSATRAGTGRRGASTAAGRCSSTCGHSVSRRSSALRRGARRFCREFGGHGG
jgi:hypothetical protein